MNGVGICAHCSTEFVKPHGNSTLCSDECRKTQVAKNAQKNYAAKRSRNPGFGTCEVCEAEYKKSRSTQRICSKECQLELNRRRAAIHNEKKRQERDSRPRLKQCKQCSEDFDARTSRAVYCSDACRQVVRNTVSRDWESRNVERRKEYKQQYREENADTIREKSKEWREANAEKTAEYMAEYRRKNAAQIAEHARQYREQRREHYLALYARYRRDNPERHLAHVRARRARKLNAEAGLPYTAQSVTDEHGWICYLCQEPIDQERKHPYPWSLNLDHVVPLARDGAECATNILPTHARCNARKNDRLLEELDLPFPGPSMQSESFECPTTSSGRQDMTVLDL